MFGQRLVDVNANFAGANRHCSLRGGRICLTRRSFEIRVVFNFLQIVRPDASMIY